MQQDTILIAADLMDWRSAEAELILDSVESAPHRRPELEWFVVAEQMGIQCKRLAANAGNSSARSNEINLPMTGTAFEGAALKQ